AISATRIGGRANGGPSAKSEVRSSKYGFLNQKTGVRRLKSDGGF
ncbi:MAG: hypothetical protein QG578_751, partial [Thermodesulfobacteriota bacterium]|nr:hypothetical protein [Thermodesulfobacteriota bacterium]